MTTVVTILTPGFADWETALLNAVSHTFYKIDTHFATQGGQAVTSAGGMRITPDLAIENIDPSQLDALVVCGGDAWSRSGAPDLSDLLRRTRDAGKTVAGICDGTLALARSGVLDTVNHTSNSTDNLTPTGYAGASHYKDQPMAVVDGRIVTAPGTAPVSFMAGVLETLGLNDDNLKFYLGLHAAEHKAA
jgi:putative intracellular protease/amidase